MTTRQEQIMIHLFGQMTKGNGYEMPYQTTQDGIAEAIGISRGQISIEMRRLEAKGLVTHLQRHACSERLRSRANRMCYRLEAQGVLTVQELMNAIEEVA